MKEKVALFDFCETLCQFQTADRFVDFVRNQRRNPICLAKKSFSSLLRKLQIIRVLGMFFPKASINKRLVLWQLRSFRENELETMALQYYQACIKPSLIPPVVAELLRKQAEGYRIMIVSGGYDIYLKYFAQEYGIADVIATKIKMKDGICKGSFDGIDCLWENKLTLLNAYCMQQGIQIDQEQSYAYSDSRSDLPLLAYVAHPVVVKRKESPLCVELNNQEIIVWEN